MISQSIACGVRKLGAIVSGGGDPWGVHGQNIQAALYRVRAERGK